MLRPLTSCIKDVRMGGHYMESLCLNEVPTYKDQLLNNKDNIMEQK